MDSGASAAAAVHLRIITLMVRLGGSNNHSIIELFCGNYWYSAYSYCTRTAH